MRSRIPSNGRSPGAKRRRLVSLLVAGAVVVLAPAHALACPSCPTARAVARVVCSGDAWTNVAAVTAPFTILALLVAVLHRIDS